MGVCEGCEVGVWHRHDCEVVHEVGMCAFTFVCERGVWCVREVYGVCERCMVCVRGVWCVREVYGVCERGVWCV